MNKVVLLHQSIYESLFSRDNLNIDFAMKIYPLVFTFLIYTFKSSSAGKLSNSADHGKKKESTLISESTECSSDVRKLCSHTERSDDLTVLNCLQDNEDVMKAVSPACQHFLWSYKRSLTTSDHLAEMARSQCGPEIENFKECRSEKAGHKVPCLLAHKEEVIAALKVAADSACRKFLTEASVFVFADYQLIYRFVERCENDIAKSQCGRLATSQQEPKQKTSDTESSESLIEFVTSQADTIDCLVNAVGNMSKLCQHEVLRLTELQADDYHLNRKLYLACREDRDKFCYQVAAGEGRVYACLMKHKFSDGMSSRCKEQLTHKQQAEARDFKADYTLYSQCKFDIDRHQCALSSSAADDEVVVMSTVLLCLEEAETRGGKIRPNCKAELTQKRLEMIEDLNVSPEVVVACIQDVKSHCDDADSRGEGGVLHCLMRLATPDEKHPRGLITSTCRVALTQLLKVANPSEDVMMLDPAIRDSCSSSLATICGGGILSKEQAFQCLVQNLDSADMSPGCRSNLVSLLYFMSIDFSIDYAVHRACLKDSAQFCNGPRSAKEARMRTAQERQSEFFCLYQTYRKDRVQLDLAARRGKSLHEIKRNLSADCTNELFSLIKAQASQIQLDPVVFDSCLEDLANLCGDPKGKGREHECLQENFNNLQAKCKKAVIEFSQMEDADIRLNQKLTEACKPMTKRFCSKNLPEETLACLIHHKRHPDMIEACQAALEHFQILSLEEYRIDHRFATFCGEEIKNYCSDELKIGNDEKDPSKMVVSKVAIVSCLSRTVVNKLVEGKPHPLSKICRQQFSFELLQRSDSITLDRNLQNDCRNDIKKYCSKVEKVAPDQVSTCLRRHQDELEDQCHRRIFQRERMEALDANFDGRLKRVCAQMIEEHCHDVSGTQLFQCLHRFVDTEDFDEDCRQVVYLRLERRMNDVRLNPGLLKDCSFDIKTHCQKENIEKMEPANGIEFEGAIIQCLKETFSNNSNSLQNPCRQRILKIIIEANAHLRLDPVLRRKCMPQIQLHCNKELMNTDDTSLGGVHDCLKHLFLRKILRDASECEHEIHRLLREGRADVHVDSQLYDACADSLMKYCNSESFGDGRKMSCLLAFADDKKMSVLLDRPCLDMLQDRREMWSLAANFQPQSLQDIMLQVNQSSMRTYLFSMFGIMIMALILLGICCGRLTKRVHVDMKNK